MTTLIRKFKGQKQSLRIAKGLRLEATTTLGIAFLRALSIRAIAFAGCESGLFAFTFFLAGLFLLIRAIDLMNVATTKLLAGAFATMFDRFLRWLGRN